MLYSPHLQVCAWQGSGRLQGAQCAGQEEEGGPPGRFSGFLWREVSVWAVGVSWPGRPGGELPSSSSFLPGKPGRAREPLQGFLTPFSMRSFPVLVFAVGWAADRLLGSWGSGTARRHSFLLPGLLGQLVGRRARSSPGSLGDQAASSSRGLCGLRNLFWVLPVNQGWQGMEGVPVGPFGVSRAQSPVLNAPGEAGAQREGAGKQPRSLALASAAVWGLTGSFLPAPFPPSSLLPGSASSAGASSPGPAQPVLSAAT